MKIITVLSGNYNKIQTIKKHGIYIYEIKRNKYIKCDNIVNNSYNILIKILFTFFFNKKVN